MTVRLAAACLFMLPLCSNASPLGVLTAPFASKVLIQQRQDAARDNQPTINAAQAHAEACQASLNHSTHAGRADEKPARCDVTEGETVADRNTGSESNLPDADKKRSAD